MKRNILRWFPFLGILIVTFACAVIKPGQVGMKQTLGKLKTGTITPGIKMYNPFVSKIIKMNTRTVELYETLELPTKEGLNIKTEIIL